MCRFASVGIHYSRGYFAVRASHSLPTIQPPFGTFFRRRPCRRWHRNSSRWLEGRAVNCVSCCPFDAFGGRGVVSLLQELIKIVQKRPLSRDRSRNDSTWFSFFFLFVFTLWLGLPRALALGMICYYLGITRTLVVYWIPEPGRPF